MLSLIAAACGAALGSFIAVAVVRWGIGESARSGRSRCDGCGAPISIGDLVPILSYLRRRGTARCCGGRIDPLHLWAESGGAIIGGLAFVIAPPAQALAGAIFGWLLLALALFDLRYLRLPDALTLPLAVGGVAVALLLAPAELTDRVIGGVLAIASLSVIRLTYRAVRGRDGLGAGDAKLFGAIGLWLGWHALPMLLLLASLLGLVVAAIMHAAGDRLQPTTRLPFGAFLAAAAWSIWVVDASLP